MFKLTSDHGHITCELCGDGAEIYADILCGVSSVIEKLNQSEAGKQVVEMLKPQFAADGAVFNKKEALEKLGHKEREKKRRTQRTHLRNSRTRSVNS